MANTEENENINLMANISQVREQMNEEQRSLEKEISKLRDPTVHAAIMYTAAKERESTNRILKTILARMDAMELKIQRLEERTKTGPASAARMSERVMADVDNTIISFIKSKGSCTAGDIQLALRYKGRNAACARLNRLYELGMLNKQRSGKKIIYTTQA